MASNREEGGAGDQRKHTPQSINGALTHSLGSLGVNCFPGSHVREAIRFGGDDAIYPPSCKLKTGDMSFGHAQAHISSDKLHLCCDEIAGSDPYLEDFGAVVGFIPQGGWMARVTQCSAAWLGEHGVQPGFPAV